MGASALRYGATALLSAVSVVLSLPAQADVTLDSQYTLFLDDGCVALFGGLPLGDLSPELDLLCTLTSGSTGGSGSGGPSATSHESGSVDAGEEDIRRRLEKARIEKQEGALPQYASLAQAQYFTHDIVTESGFSVFISGDHESRDRKVTTLEDGHNADLGSLTLGGDYRLGGTALVGLALNYGDLSGTFYGGGDFDTKSYGVALYASYFPNDNFFADLVLGYARKDYEVERIVSFSTSTGPIVSPTAISSDTDGNEFSFRGLMGYDFRIGKFAIGPRVGANYVFTDIDGFTELGSTGMELKFDERSRTSLQSTVGVQASAAVDASFGTFVPRVRIDWVHEFRNEQQSIDVQFAGDLQATPTKFIFNNDWLDQDFFTLRIGAYVALDSGVQPYVEYRQLFGHSFFDSYGGTIGVRIAF